MAGMFRGGHMRPTFDTAVEFVAVNQTATDKSGGYGSPVTTRGPWGAPEVMTETTVKSRDAFVPTGDNGVQATSIGIFLWFVQGGNQYVMHQSSATNRAYIRVRPRSGNGWGAWTSNFGPGIELRLDQLTGSWDANVSRNDLPKRAFARIDQSADVNVSNNLPPISYIDPSNYRFGILIDDATGQSLYYCNNITGQCEHYRRAIDDGTGPASRTYMADVKDIAGSERVLGDQSVAVRTKSLVFAHATLKPLLDAEGSIAKDWKVRINGRDMDITGVMDGWVPNRYTRLTVEDRS